MQQKRDLSPEPIWVQRLAWLAPLAGYTLLAVLLAWPLPLQLSSHVPYGGDAMQYLWNLWWFRQAAEAGFNPFHTTLLYHPYGVSMAFSTLVPLESAATVPLQWAGLSLIACYNLLLLLSSMLGAWAMYALARRLTGSRAAAAVAGLAYGWAPFHSAHVMGHLNLASHQWLPLYVLALLRTLDAVWPGAAEEGWQAGAEQQRPWRWALLAGLAAAATAYTEVTYAVLLLLWTLLYLAYRAWPLLRQRAVRTLARAAGPLGLLGALALLLALPLLLPTLRELRSADYMVLDPHETLVYSADPLWYLLPSELHPLVGARLQPISARSGSLPAERVVTLGYTLPLLAVTALLLGPRRRALRFWLWSSLLCALLSLGPLLRVYGRVTWTVFHASVVLPYALLYYLPGFSAMRTPARFAVLVLLGGVVLAAYGLAALQRRWPRASRLFIPLAALAILAEFWVRPPLIELSEYPLAQVMQRDQVPGAVLDLPLRPMVDYLWYQTRHERPIVGGHLSRQPPDRFAAENPAMLYLQASTPVSATAAVADGAGLRSLQRAGVRYVVVHWWASDDSRPALERKLELLFDGLQPVELPEERLRYYVLPGPGQP